MKRIKTKKGVTLVALIITIVVLLIIAGVTINSVQNDGIIDHAKNAKTQYMQAQEKEEAFLTNYIDYIEGNY